MDPTLLTLAGEAGTAVVTLAVTEAWQQARDGIVTVWRRYRPQAADEVGEELETSRRALLAATADGDDAAAAGQRIADAWQLRLVALLADHPGAADDLRTLLAALNAEPARQNVRGDVRLQARASGSARIYQSMGDQHITER